MGKGPEASTPADDDSLMRRIAGGDEAAFALLMDRHLARAVALARRVTGSPAIAEEIAQEAFLRVWTRAADWQPQARVSTWLWRIVMNLALDQMRRRRPAALDEVPEPVDPGEDPEAAALRNALGRALEAALAGLPERQAQAVRLCLVDGFSQAEASAVLEVSEGALESLLVRARRSLRSSLSAYAPAEAS
ncbi:RNA polymerase sigma-70 factor (ECF subfamily) [Zavarzinia compransoris]|uniref:RNA polymerase sigma factor n=2 Tax=Zavarzinia compransoris TaxID=1264899 RepID=A0A317DUN0_9PROT|nr:RNA polymerase sigma-70 factor [Zavarzinia compransoris]TDP43506.1 RNA polymerase sigma-70 factor (ECF subfamily) [Zavarzinia compransoris]